MTKSELIEKVRQEVGAHLPLKSVRTIIDAFVEVVKNAVASGDRIVLKGFITLEAVKKVERFSRNPQTGERITIPLHHGVRVKTSPAFRKMVGRSLDVKKGKKKKKK